MRDETRQLLDKSARAIKAAELLSADGLHEFSIGRAYYAMFYAAEALLNERELRFSTPSTSASRGITVSSPRSLPRMRKP